ncbi:sunset domain-containing protein, partial [Bacillus toyonensis]|uniref:sunset domain-containing protein n=2 Tax=Bacillaceae TaxID=186817 RepID=UPI00305E64EE
KQQEQQNQNKQNEATPQPKTNQASEQNGTCNIKGNKNSKGEKIYHMPGQQFYDKTNAEEMFCSAAEAQAAGYRASKR